MGAQGSSSAPPEGSNPAMFQPAMGTATGKGSSSAPLSQPEMTAQTSANPAMAYSYTNPNNVNAMAQQFSGQNHMGTQQQGQMPMMQVSPQNWGQQPGQMQAQVMPHNWSQQPGPMAHVPGPDHQQWDVSRFADRLRGQGMHMPQGFGQFSGNYQDFFRQMMERFGSHIPNNPIAQQLQSSLSGTPAPGTTATTAETPPANPAAEIQTSQPRGFGDFKRGGAVSGRKLTSKEMATLREALAIARRVMPKG